MIPPHEILENDMTEADQLFRVGDGRRKGLTEREHERTFPITSLWKCSVSWLQWRWLCACTQWAKLTALHT